MKRLTARRAATFLAALGMLVMSSGVALMVAATPANAEPSDCTEHTGWIEVNANATSYTYNAPDGKLISAVCAKGPKTHPLFFDGPFNPGVASYTFKAADYGWLNDNEQVQNISHIGVKLVDKVEEQPVLVTATVTPNTPTCEHNVASYSTTGEHVSFSNSAPPAFGTTITVTATADEGYAFEGGKATQQFSVTFPAAATGCNQDPGVVTATVTPNTPTCENNVASYSKTGEHVTFKESAAPAFGTTITVTATADEGFEFAGGDTKKEFSVTFPAAATGCDDQVSPPVTDGGVSPSIVVSPPSSTGSTSSTSSTVTPTVVHAGLAGASTPDLRGEQGLALVFAGMLLLLGAGGLVVRTSGRMSRI